MPEVRRLQGAITEGPVAIFSKSAGGGASGIRGTGEGASGIKSVAVFADHEVSCKDAISSGVGASVIKKIYEEKSGKTT
jgi:hypothetical protein